MTERELTRRVNFVEKSINKVTKGLSDKEKYRVYNSISYRCIIKSDNLPDQRDDHQKTYDDQRMEPYH